MELDKKEYFKRNKLLHVYPWGIRSKFKIGKTIGFIRNVHGEKFICKLYSFL